MADAPPITFSISVLEAVASTNDLVLERIRSGDARAGEVVVARAQSGARGRMGRAWAAERGGLWFTATLPLRGEHVGWAGLLAALAVCRALDAEGLQAGVKWPNDVVVGGRKLAGVLVEATAGRELAAVGIGLNVSNPLPPLTPASAAAWPPTSVARETGREVDPLALLPPILAQMGELWRVWEAGRRAELRELWSGRDACRGRPVRLLPAGPTGTAEGIDLTGALQVRLQSGEVQLVLAGELVFVL